MPLDSSTPKRISLGPTLQPLDSALSSPLPVHPLFPPFSIPFWCFQTQLECPLLQEALPDHSPSPLPTQLCPLCSDGPSKGRIHMWAPSVPQWWWPVPRSEMLPGRGSQEHMRDHREETSRAVRKEGLLCAAETRLSS